MARYLLRLAEAGSEQRKAVEKYIIQQMASQGLQCERVGRETETGIIVSASSKLLAQQAEKLKWKRILKKPEMLQEFSVARRAEFLTSAGKEVFTSAEETRLLYHAIQGTPFDQAFFKEHKYEVEEAKEFLSALQESKPPLIEEAYPLHDPVKIGALSRMFRFSFIPMYGVSVEKIRGYFGEEVAFYFGWMNFYLLCIMAPALLGLAMYIVRPTGVSVDTDAYLPFYSIVMALWGVLFIVFWQRRSAVHSFQWNTYNYSASEEVRPEFYGARRPHPVTGEPSIHYPHWKRKLWYMFSIVAMVPLLAAGVGIMTLSLNLQGYVKDPASPIYVATLARFAQPGGLLAGDSPYFLWLIPPVAHSIIVNMINQLYSKVAEKCTDLENHRTKKKWMSSLVIKRVSFECFDCFMPLFYIAFYQLDVITLRQEIASLFLGDEVRRVVMETLIPFVKIQCMTRMKRKTHGSVPDAFLAEYEQFDDYLEMVVQFGYVTLFASAFPLGGAVTLLFLYIELRSDVFKLLYAYRRPLPSRARDIGVWFDVMKVMVFAAILTNSAILGFSSEQLMQWLPSLFIRDKTDGDQLMAMGSGRYVVGVVFGFEHALLLGALWLQWAIHPVPKWVRTAIARRGYLARKEKAKTE